MQDEIGEIRYSSPNRIIKIDDNKIQDRFYPRTTYSIGSYTAIREGKIPEEEMQEINELLEDAENPEKEEKTLKELLNPVNWFIARHEIQKGDDVYSWEGEGPKQLEEAAREINRLASEYATEIKY